MAPYRSEASPDPILSQADTLDAVFKDAVSKRPQAEAVVCGAIRLSYAQADALSERIAWALKARGVGPGDRVAVLAWPRPEVLLLTLACTRLGATYMGLGERLMESDLSFIFKDARPKLVFAARHADGTDIQAVVENACAHADLARPVMLTLSEHALAFELTAMIDDAEPSGDLPGSVAEDVLAIIYTSGTTGTAKGVKIGHRAVIRSCRVFIGRSGSGPVRSLSILPIDHVGFLTSDVIRPLLTGEAAIQVRKFDPELIMDVIERERPTVWCAIPTMLQRLVNHPRFAMADLSSLEFVWWGGVLSGNVFEKVRAKWRRLGCGYGMTEASGGISLTSVDAGREELLTSAGRPHDGMAVRIKPDLELDEGVGEVQLKSEYLMLGYLHPEHEAQAFDDGWYRTGDLGRLDNGLLRLVGRKKELIRSGGYNVSPSEVEAAILAEPGVAYAVVFGMPDPEYGEAVNAVWAPVPGADLDEAQLRARVRARLSGFKTPKRFWRQDDMPLLRNNKVDRRTAVEAVRARIGAVQHREEDNVQ